MFHLSALGKYLPSIFKRQITLYSPCRLVGLWSMSPLILPSYIPYIRVGIAASVSFVKSLSLPVNSPPQPKSKSKVQSQIFAQFTWFSYRTMSLGDINNHNDESDANGPLDNSGRRSLQASLPGSFHCPRVSLLCRKPKPGYYCKVHHFSHTTTTIIITAYSTPVSISAK